MMFPGAVGSRGGSIDSLRRHNLALVLRSVHLAPTTRSGLTRSSGLNRSTIGALVSELEVRRLVVEDQASASGQVGRPSPVVRPSDVPLAIAIGPEVDAITVAVVRLGGRVVARERVPFDAAPSMERAVEAAVPAVRRLLAGMPEEHRVVGAGVAVPGIVRRSDGVVRLAPNLGWRDAPIAEALAAELGVPVSAGNDATLGARAEWIFGAGRGADDLVYLHGGTGGIGGGVVSGGVLLAGATGHAGEFGHSTVRRGDGTRDGVGLTGTLESEVRRESLLAALGLDRADPDEFEASLTATASPEVRAEVRRQVEVLAVAVANAVTILNPSRVVLGGFLGALAAVEHDLLASLVAQRVLPGIHEDVDIRRALLGGDLLLIGAAELAFTGLLSDPLRD